MAFVIWWIAWWIILFKMSPDSLENTKCHCRSSSWALETDLFLNMLKLVVLGCCLLHLLVIVVLWTVFLSVSPCWFCGYWLNSLAWSTPSNCFSLHTPLLGPAASSCWHAAFFCAVLFVFHFLLIHLFFSLQWSLLWLCCCVLSDRLFPYMLSPVHAWTLSWTVCLSLSPGLFSVPVTVVCGHTCYWRTVQVGRLVKSLMHLVRTGDQQKVVDHHMHLVNSGNLSQGPSVWTWA